MINHLYSWFPVMAWAGLIFTLSHIPSLDSGLGVWDFIFRKFAHVVEYAILVILLARAIQRSWSPAWMKLFIWSGLCSLLYAMSDEFHQLFVPGRGPFVGDVVIDACGIVVGILIYRRWVIFG